MAQPRYFRSLLMFVALAAVAALSYMVDIPLRQSAFFAVEPHVYPVVAWQAIVATIGLTAMFMLLFGASRRAILASINSVLATIASAFRSEVAGHSRSIGGAFA